MKTRKSQEPEFRTLPPSRIVETDSGIFHARAIERGGIEVCHADDADQSACIYSVGRDLFPSSFAMTARDKSGTDLRPNEIAMLTKAAGVFAEEWAEDRLLAAIVSTSMTIEAKENAHADLAKRISPERPRQVALLKSLSISDRKAAEGGCIDFPPPISIEVAGVGTIVASFQPAGWVRLEAQSEGRVAAGQFKAAGGGGIVSAGAFDETVLGQAFQRAIKTLNQKHRKEIEAARVADVRNELAVIEGRLRPLINQSNKIARELDGLRAARTDLVASWDALARLAEEATEERRMRA